MKKLLSILAVLVVLSLFAGTAFFLWKKSRKVETVYETEAPKVATIIKKAVRRGR